ncbi:MAG: hypothetical protein ABI418_12535 [Jatrophihabitantaceae bacterium]
MTSPDVNALRTRARGRVDVALGIARASAATLLTLALPGSVYLYQGEELGLPEVQDLPDEARQDPIWERSGHTEYGRDGCRVPLPWTAEGSSFGFSASGSQPAWLPQPAWFADFAADRQADDPDSVLSFYRAALRARAAFAQTAFDQAADFEWLHTGREDVLAFRRGTLISVTVFDGPDYAVAADWGTPICASRSGLLTNAPRPAASTTWYRS